MTLGLLSFLSIFVPALLGLFCWSKTEPSYKLFSCFIFAVGIIECMGNYQFYTHQSNSLIYSIGLLLETVFLSFFLAYFSLNRGLIRNTVFISGILYFLYFLYHRIILIKTEDTSHELRIITCVFLIFVSGLSILKQSREVEVNIFKNPLFVLSFTVLFYYSATLFIHDAMHLILRKSFTLVANQIWNAHSVINIISNLFLGISIWLSYLRKKSFLL